MREIPNKGQPLIPDLSLQRTIFKLSLGEQNITILRRHVKAMEVLHHLQAQPLPMEDLISWSDHLNWWSFTFVRWQSMGCECTCPSCWQGWCLQMFLQDDGCSTGTSSDDGTNVDGLSNQDGAETYQDYAFALKRWRKFSDRGPRRYRRSWNHGKGFKAVEERVVDPIERTHATSMVR